ncbi:Galactokinase [Candidatus Methylobacter favarea]|uniref:Galactokinase n=1 Tax=Candidatus Methylobacter favarea TaxID=2707345 RepID=A0A8S0X0D3_9GAMM|nr:galactokinase [Candidatus Methylobacter favarea]CAA9890568.1 Galactokinase [Candidatus Methylobacter favarea]
MKTFEQIFGAPWTAAAEAPGRVNLLGEHTDYNDGYVLPIAIPQKTRVFLRPGLTKVFRLYTASLDEVAEFDLTSLPDRQFARYIYGCLRQLEILELKVPVLDIYIDSQVPMELGLSSSAALEVATLRALRLLLQLPLDDVRIAQLAQRAEIEYAGVNCGIMDQMASSLADSERMLFLDTRTLERELLPLPDDSEILVVDSGVKRTLAASKYNERRSECESAAQQLGVAALRDVTDPERLASLPPRLRRRAHHVVTENNRVLRARQGITPEEFGQLMNASHASLRDDYEVSIAELDQLAALLQGQPGVYGARLTGAGFGGACVALCKSGTAIISARTVLGLYNRPERKGRRLVPEEAGPKVQ